MGSRRRKSKSHKVYTVAAFATKKQMRRMKLRDGGSPPTSPGHWFEMLHCRYPAVVNANCYQSHVQVKVQPPK